MYIESISCQVGGVQFKAPGCNNKTLGNMRNHLEIASKSKAVHCGSTFETFGYGDMFGVGSRQPQGGRGGDTYTVYPHLRADTVQGIKTLFFYAYVGVS